MCVCVYRISRDAKNSKKKMRLYYTPGVSALVSNKEEVGAESDRGAVVDCVATLLGSCSVDLLCITSPVSISNANTCYLLHLLTLSLSTQTAS